MPINISTDNTIYVNYPKMREFESTYEQAEASLRSVERTLHDIDETIKYVSLAGILYKYKIRCAGVRAEANVKAISACGTVLNDAISEYQNTDAQIADSYGTFIVGTANG